jgi:DNA polymerase-3 subunit epsilon
VKRFVLTVIDLVAGKTSHVVTPPDPERREPIRWVSDDSVEIPATGFFGRGQRSPNGTYALAWSDSDPLQGVYGSRTSGLGRYVLIRGNEVLLDGRLERPNDGKVANNGIFVLNDWLFDSGLSGVFHALRPTGQGIVQHRFEANLHTNGLSDNGEFAVCQTCNSPTEDGNKLSFFDLRTGALIWSINPPTGWASSYRFDVERQLLGLGYGELGVFNYSFNGEFLDADRWEEAQIERGDGWAIFQIATDRLEQHQASLDANTASELLRLFDIAAERLQQLGSVAVIERRRGEIYEQLGDKQSAIAQYEKALALDPKAGVKRKLAALTGQKLTGRRPAAKHEAPGEMKKLAEVGIEVEEPALVLRVPDVAPPVETAELGRFVAVDVETANPDVASICQVGLVAFDRGEQADIWQTLVNPEDYFDPWNVAIHGITEGMVAGSPNFAAIYDELAARLSGRIVVCHTPFDRGAFAKASEKYGVGPLECTWLDSAKVVRRAWPEYSKSGFALAKVSEALGIDFKHHVAAEDARAAGELVVRAIRRTGLALEKWLTQVEQPITQDQRLQIERDGDPNGPLAGEVVVFTGTLSRTRIEAAQLAASVGCRVEDRVTEETTILVVGEQNLERLAGYHKSSKHRKAEAMIGKGHEIRIIGEGDFTRLVALSPKVTAARA